jgi:hypothetical protein
MMVRREEGGRRQGLRERERERERERDRVSGGHGVEKARGRIGGR